MGGDGRILLDVDSGDFAIIVPNTKFLMFYNCFGYLYYSICSPREERLGIFAIYIININLLYQSQSPRALEPLKDTNKIGYTYQLHTGVRYTSFSQVFCSYGAAFGAGAGAEGCCFAL